MYPELQTVADQLAEVNITVLSGNPAGYPIEFDGDEDQFVNALEVFMSSNGYRKQDEAWFPGDPGEMGDQDYYIMNDDIEFCISYESMFMSDII